MDEDITYGGFFSNNIVDSIIADCCGSGDPVNFFFALLEAMECIQEEFDSSDWANWNEYWLQKMVELQYL